MRSRRQGNEEAGAQWSFAAGVMQTGAGSRKAEPPSSSLQPVKWWTTWQEGSRNELCRLLAPVRRRQWHPTPVLLPGKSHGRRSLVGSSPWGR